MHYQYLLFALEVAACLAALWLLIFSRPQANTFKPSEPSVFVAGYEIPNPHVSTIATHAVIGLGPALGSMALHRPILAVVALLVGVGLFHVRNLAVRKENERGLHDSLWGLHLQRQRQAAFDRALPKGLRWLVALRKMMYSE